jgi:hypothetical protein
METINPFNSEKQNLTRQVEQKKEAAMVLPEKYCPNCGMKHQVKAIENVYIEGLPKDCKHLMFYIDCPDENGTKRFVKYVAPFTRNVVFMSYFCFRKEDIVQ